MPPVALSSPDTETVASTSPPIFSADSDAGSIATSLTRDSFVDPDHDTNTVVQPAGKADPNAKASPSRQAPSADGNDAGANDRSLPQPLSLPAATHAHMAMWVRQQQGLLLHRHRQSLDGIRRAGT